MNYNANDIEQYVRNKMNAAEMHAFEQAMMDDPFLADAVDGYSSAAGKINVQADLTQLKERLAAQQKQAPVVTGFFRPWMRIAAGFIILLSTAVVMYRIFNQPEEKNTSPVAESLQKDTASTVQSETIVDSTTVALNEKQPAAVNPSSAIELKKRKTIKDSATNTALSNKPSIAAAEPAIITNQSGTSGVVAPSPAKTRKEDTRFKETEVAEDKNQSGFVTLNKFSGVVVDENNQPLPFANITEKKSGVGTYADVNGNFTLIAADSIINIETKSVGYFSNSLQMRNNQTQRIVLKDEAVIANAPTRERLYQKNKDRPSAMKTEVNELYSEPADGWNNYNKYVANNLRDGNLKEQKQANELKEVEISFDVKPDGTVANLKVERSNCKNCNKEAIRLIQEGPKWKSKTGKTERTRLTLHF